MQCGREAHCGAEWVVVDVRVDDLFVGVFGEDCDVVYLEFECVCFLFEVDAWFDACFVCEDE